MDIKKEEDGLRVLDQWWGLKLSSWSVEMNNEEGLCIYDQAQICKALILTQNKICSPYIIHMGQNRIVSTDKVPEKSFNYLLILTIFKKQPKNLRQTDN